MAGRCTDSMRPRPKRAAATTAPVFPAETMASVRRSFWSRAAMLIEESFFFRTEVAADSPISTRSDAWITGGSAASTWRRLASMAPWITTPGARSPPMASTPMTGGPARSLTAPPPPPLRALRPLLRDHLFARVVAAVAAHAVRKLRLAAVRAERPGWHREFPVRAALLAAGARVSSLGYGHGSTFPSLKSWTGFRG